MQFSAQNFSKNRFLAQTQGWVSPVWEILDLPLLPFFKVTDFIDLVNFGQHSSIVCSVQYWLSRRVYEKLYCLSMESIRLGGPAHGIVTITLHKTLSGGGGGWVGRGVVGIQGVVGPGTSRGGGVQGVGGVQG